MVRRTTIKKRMAAKLRSVKAELMRRRHLPIPKQGRWLASVVRGHLAYYAVPGNIDTVLAFRTQATRHGYQALRRRSQRHRLNWTRMNRLSVRWLPPARVTHPWPDARFDVRTRGRSPVRRDLRGGPPERGPYRDRYDSKVAAELRRVARRISAVRKRGGIKGLVTRSADKAFVYAIYPLQRARLGRRGFTYGGERLPFLVHHYNATWRCERLVEIPIAQRFLERRAAGGVEVGNVLAYYLPIEHTVVDKYERSAGVLNVDVVDYSPERPAEWIIAISTLEHVGWDETPRRPEKLEEAVRHLRTMLAPGGRMLVTSPRGFNTFLDHAIATGSLEPTEEHFLHRDGRHSWSEEPRGTALARRPVYDLARGSALDLWVAEFDPAQLGSSDHEAH